MSLLWRVYYDDGTTIDNSEKDPHHVRRDGVVCIVQPDSGVGRIVLHRWDYYCWRNDEQCWYGSELGGFWDYLFNHTGPLAVLFGRTLPTDKYSTILKAASSDNDFSVKSAHRPIETPQRR